MRQPRRHGRDPRRNGRHLGLRAHRDQSDHQDHPGNHRLAHRHRRGHRARRGNHRHHHRDGRHQDGRRHRQGHPDQPRGHPDHRRKHPAHRPSDQASSQGSAEAASSQGSAGDQPSPRRPGDQSPQWGEWARHRFRPDEKAAAGSVLPGWVNQAGVWSDAMAVLQNQRQTGCYPLSGCVDPASAPAGAAAPPRGTLYSPHPPAQRRPGGESAPVPNGRGDPAVRRRPGGPAWRRPDGPAWQVAASDAP